jgi:hypothetical protein
LPHFYDAGPKDFISYGATQRTLSQYVEAGWKLLEGTS